MLREALFDKVKSVILTSATISTGGQADSFKWFKSRIGLDTGTELELPSFFNYREQAKLILVRDMADPARDRDLHFRQSLDAIRHYVERTDGHAFVLFTSYDALRRSAERLAPWCRNATWH